MKNHSLFLFLALFAILAWQSPAYSQVSAQKQETSAQQAREGRTDAEPLIATLSRALVDRTDSVVVSAWGGTLTFEGATADAYETSIAITDPTADRTITVPNASGTVTLAQASTTTALTADNQAVTPGSNTRLQLTSDDATATNRTFTLSATGAITGQIYILIGPATNQCEIADTGIQVLSATWSPTTGDSLTLLFDGTSFIELARANN
jgi:hypothetical protein